MTSLTDVIAAKMKDDADRFKTLLALAANNRKAIYAIADLVDGIPGIDKQKISAIVTELDNFDPIAEMRDDTAAT